MSYNCELELYCSCEATTGTYVVIGTLYISVFYIEYSGERLGLLENINSYRFIYSSQRWGSYWKEEEIEGRRLGRRLGKEDFHTARLLWRISNIASMVSEIISEYLQMQFSLTCIENILCKKDIRNSYVSYAVLFSNLN